MSSHPRQILVLAATLLSAACTGYTVARPLDVPAEALGPPPLGLAKICVFRGSWIGFALTIPVRDNGELVGATIGKGHFCYHATPGRHTITVEVSDAAPLVLFAEVGGLHYVEHSINVGVDSLADIDPLRGQQLAVETPYSLVESAPWGERPPAVMPTATGH